MSYVTFRAMVDAARLAEELRCEQDAASQHERDRRLLEAQVRTNHNTASRHVISILIPDWLAGEGPGDQV